MKYVTKLLSNPLQKTKDILQSIVQRLCNGVTREEFELQQQVLLETRRKLDILEQKDKKTD